MVLKIKITNIKNYKKDLGEREGLLRLNKSKTDKEILTYIGIKGNLIDYFTFDKKPIRLRDKIENNEMLQTIPFISGG